MADERDAATPGGAAPRYSERALPAQRYLPGRTPRPRMAEAGGVNAAAAAGGFDADAFWSSEAFLHGVDLWNNRCFWEAHETWEEPWRAAGREAPLGRFLQGLILLAAAALKREVGAERAARRLAARGARRLAQLELQPPFDARAFAGEVEAWIGGRRAAPPRLRLAQAPPAELARSFGSVWGLAWPAIVGNLLNSSVGLVDLKIVGVLGAPAIAAVTTGNRLFFVIQAALMAVCTGTTALVARAWGAGERSEAALVTRASLWLCVGLALAVTLPGVLFARAIAGLFRLEPETVELAAVYIRWLSAFHVVFAVGFVLSTALRAAGDTRTPLAVGALANVVNVALAYGLVNGRLGLPQLGVAGAAIAGGLSFAVSALVLVALWLGGRLRVGAGRGRALERPRVVRLLRIGYPAGLEQGVWQAGFLIFLWIVALYGTAPYAAYGIGVSLLSFSFVVGFGFSIAASTLVGQHLGAGDPDGAAQRGWQATGLAVGVMLVLGSAIVLAAEPLARFLIDEPEVVRLTVAFIYVLGSVQVLMAVEFTLSGALRGAGDTRFPLVTVTSGLFGGRIALAALFAWRGLRVEWVFAALIADYMIKTGLLIWRFRSRRWVDALR